MKNLFKISLALVVSAFLFSSCSCYKKMIKQVDGMTVVCAPEIAPLKGNNVLTNATVTFPAKSFHKWGVLKLTPVLVYEGGETAGQPFFFQGESVSDNYRVVNYKNPTDVLLEISIAYKPEMRISKLIFRAEAKCLKQGKKIKEFTPCPEEIVIAQGVNAMQLMADNFAQVAIAPDAFQRITHIADQAEIHFQISSANVSAKQLNSEDIKALEQFIIENDADPRRTVGQVYTQAYASPDGPLKLNDKLSKQRGETTHKALQNRFKRAKVPATTTFDINAMGEDWEGFKELVQKSDIADKNLILQVLSMYSDPQVRDREIKNMTATFVVLAEKILPELRRSKMVVNVEIQGKTDEELRDAVKTDINSLNLEEMLFSATLFVNATTKAAIYKAAADKFNDFRAWNNLGVCKAWMGEYAAAAADFQKAASLNSNNPQVINNLGVVALAEGRKDEAAKYFASSTTPEAKYNKGLVELANGNYANAISMLNGYNKALAQYLNGDISAAKATVAPETSWKAHYLKAVIAAAEGNIAEMDVNIAKAVELGGDSVAALASTEINFIAAR